MPWWHLASAFHEGRYSQNLSTQRYVKDKAKTRFLSLANRTLKTFGGGSTGGRWLECNANGPDGCKGHARKLSRIHSE